MKREVADRLMGAECSVLPHAEGGLPDAIGRPVQAGHGAGIEIGAPDRVADRAGAVAEGVELGLTNRLAEPADATEVVERGIAEVVTETGLAERGTGEQEK